MSEKQNNICEGQLANMREANALYFVLFTMLYEIVIPKGERKKSRPLVMLNIHSQFTAYHPTFQFIYVLKTLILKICLRTFNL